MTMVDHSDEDSEPGTYASPACFMHEVDPDVFGLASGAASAQRDNIMRWRKNERKRLIAQRLEISSEERSDCARHIGAHLDMLLPDLAGISVSLYWPFRGEPDLRGWAAAIRARGAICALPVVVEKNAPLIFSALARRRATGAGSLEHSDPRQWRGTCAGCGDRAGRRF
jgi:5-formyltetrahydrofolate cyclo-ligase